MHRLRKGLTGRQTGTELMTDSNYKKDRDKLNGERKEPGGRLALVEVRTNRKTNRTDRKTNRTDRKTNRTDRKTNRN